MGKKDKSVQKISGPISNRLREQSASDDPKWNPGRPADVEPVRGQRIPDHAEGHELHGR